MFGTYRLLLAVLVVASHVIQGPPLAFNVGVWAVVNFYLLSGFVMTALVRRHYASPRLAGYFYVDRAMRILPQYWFWLAAALALHTTVGLKSPFLSDAVSFAGIARNVLLLPMNFIMFFPGIEHFILIPPSWSLSAEVQFYLLFPLLLLWKGARTTALCLSLTVFAAAMGGALHPEWYGYRLLPGVLFFFLTGSLLFDGRHRTVAAAAGVVALLAVARGTTLGFNSVTAEVTTGFLLGVPVLWALARLEPRAWDNFLGNASYGTFLCHFPVVWALQATGWIQGRENLAAATILLSVPCGYLSYALVERPVVKRRRAFRSRHEAAPG